jgi:hypothetical protein
MNNQAAVVDVGGESVRGLLLGEQFGPDAEAVLFCVSLIFFCGGARGGAGVLFRGRLRILRAEEWGG